MYPAILRLARTMSRLRFRPLSSNQSFRGSSIPELQGIVFDVDGTLSHPQPWMFTRMRAALSVPPGTDILTHAATLGPWAMPKICEIEREAMASAQLQSGVKELLQWLEERSIRRGVLTRNYLEPVQHLLSTHLPLFASGFSPIITRDAPYPPHPPHPTLPDLPAPKPKPSPEGLLYIARAWGLPDARGLIMVGDSMDDMAAGRAAGAMTVLIANEHNENVQRSDSTDLVVGRADELIGVLENGFKERIKGVGGQDVREGTGEISRGLREERIGGSDGG